MIKNKMVHHQTSKRYDKYVVFNQTPSTAVRASTECGSVMQVEVSSQLPDVQLAVRRLEHSEEQINRILLVAVWTEPSPQSVKLSTIRNSALQAIQIWLKLLLLHPFNNLFSMTTWISWHLKGKPFWILLEQEMTIAFRVIFATNVTGDATIFSITSWEFLAKWVSLSSCRYDVHETTLSHASCILVWSCSVQMHFLQEKFKSNSILLLRSLITIIMASFAAYWSQSPPPLFYLPNMD